MKNLSKWAYVITPAIFMIAGIQHAVAQNQIKDLTSKDSAKKANAGEISKPSFKKSFNGGLKKHSVGIGLGQTFLAGDLADTGEDKITADILYNYSASHSFDLLAGIHASKHKFRDTQTELLGATLGIKAKLFQFDEFAPYGVGGFGFYAPRVKRRLEADGEVIASDRKVAFGYHLGVGADLRLNDKFTIGLLAQYHNPFDVKQDVGSEVEGSYYKLLITTFYTFK